LEEPKKVISTMNSIATSRKVEEAIKVAANEKVEEAIKVANVRSFAL